MSCACACGLTRWLRYQISPRANMFRRDQGTVSDLEGMKQLMRYNDYSHDGVSAQPWVSVTNTTVHWSDPTVVPGSIAGRPGRL